MKIKNNLVIVQFIKFDVLITIIIGNKRAISTSKIKKIIAIKKNRNEKGNREEFIGSNPHSNGEHFSRSNKVFFDNKVANIITTIVIIKIINVIVDSINIIYTKII